MWFWEFNFLFLFFANVPSNVEPRPSHLSLLPTTQISPVSSCTAHKCLQICFSDFDPTSHKVFSNQHTMLCCTCESTALTTHYGAPNTVGGLHPTGGAWRWTLAPRRGQACDHGQGCWSEAYSPQFVKLNTTFGPKQLRSIAVRGNNPSAALRISVESGGCHGYQYKMELAQETQLDD